MSQQTDVVVLGGGLAGLSLAIQLRQRDPSIAVTVLERRTHPVREAAFEVGEPSADARVDLARFVGHGSISSG